MYSDAGSDHSRIELVHSAYKATKTYPSLYKHVSERCGYSDCTHLSWWWLSVYPQELYKFMTARSATAPMMKAAMAIARMTASSVSRRLSGSRGMDRTVDLQN